MMKKEETVIDWPGIARRLKYAMDKLNLKAPAVSKLSGIGARTVHKVANCEHTSMGSVHMIAQGLGLSPLWLVNFQGPEPDWLPLASKIQSIPENNPFLECGSPPSTFGELVDALATHFGCHPMDVFEALRPLHNRVNPNPKD